MAWRPLVRGVVADGLIHPALAAAAPYDLIIANILAGPLTRLAPQIVDALAPGGILVLSGLLHNQEAMVLSFYHRLRFISPPPRRPVERAGAWRSPGVSAFVPQRFVT